MGKPLLRSSEGSLHIPMALVLMLVTVAGLGFWGTLRQWRHLVETQLRIDRCVAQTSLQLRHTLQFIEKGNSRIRWTRRAIEAAIAAVQPETVSALRTALKAQVILQTAEQSRWQMRQGLWIARRGCDGQSDWPSPLPSLPWVRDPPDWIGEKPLRWIDTQERKFLIELRHSPRAAAAEVKGKDEGKWNATWTAPHRGFGTSFY